MNDPKERETVLGPLFATEIQAGIPVFGQDKFMSKKSKLIVDAGVKKALHFTADSVINLLRPPVEASSNPESEFVTNQLEQLAISTNGHTSSEHENGHNHISGSMYSSRELHERFHSTSADLKAASSHSIGEQLDSILLRRAKRGYLFDCKLNKKIVSDDHWQSMNFSTYLASISAISSVIPAKTMPSMSPVRMASSICFDSHVVSCASSKLRRATPTRSRNGRAVSFAILAQLPDVI